MDFKEEYSNAADFNPENIPLSVLEDVADMIYDMMVRTDERAQTKKAT